MDAKYEEFKNRVLAYANVLAVAGNRRKCRFSVNTDKGVFIARIGDILITGNSLSNKLTVRWGSGHQAMV